MVCFDDDIFRIVALVDFCGHFEAREVLQRLLCIWHYSRCLMTPQIHRILLLLPRDPDIIQLIFCQSLFHIMNFMRQLSVFHLLEGGVEVEFLRGGRVDAAAGSFAGLSFERASLRCPR